MPRELDAVQAHFGFTGWPEQIVPFDLGGRVLEITGSPGHHRAAITVYDPWTGFLLTGDTVYPGRLYAFDFAQFLASLDRMVALAESRAVTHVLGCHIEMTRHPGRDYPLGALYQPDEPAPEMTVAQLRDVRAAAAAVAGKPGVHRFDDFIIYNDPHRRDHLNLAAGERRRTRRPVALGDEDEPPGLPVPQRPVLAAKPGRAEAQWIAGHIRMYRAIHHPVRPSLDLDNSKKRGAAGQTATCGARRPDRGRGGPAAA